MRREFLYLLPGKKNPEAMIEGQKRERAKAERPTEAYQRYYQMLRNRKKKLEEEKPPEEKKPRVLRPIYPVSNYQSPIIEARD